MPIRKLLLYLELRGWIKVAVAKTGKSERIQRYSGRKVYQIW